MQNCIPTETSQIYDEQSQIKIDEQYEDIS